MDNAELPPFLDLLVGAEGPIFSVSTRRGPGQQSKSGRLLPKIEPLPGSLHAQYRRCNRSNCRCARGELHGPYYRRHWWEHGRQHWPYVRGGDLTRVQAGIAAWQRLQPPVWLMRQTLRQLMCMAREELGW